MFCSWKTSSSSLNMSFLLGGIYVLETFVDNSSTFLNIVFWEILNGRPSEIIRYAIAIVRRVSLEVINFWEFPSIPKTCEQFEKLLALLSDVIFDAEVKLDISDELVSFDEVILFELLWMVDSMEADDLFCRLVMDAFYIFWIIKNNTLPSLFVILKLLVSCYMSFFLTNITTFNMHILLPQYVIKSLSSIDSLENCITSSALPVFFIKTQNVIIIPCIWN